METVDTDEIIGTDADETVGQTGVWAKFVAWLTATPLIPLPFLGLGVYRAWLNVLFDRDLIEGFGGLFVSQNAFDVVMVASLIVCLVLAHRLTPLVSQRWSRPVCMALLVCSTLCGYAAWWFPFLATPSLWHAPCSAESVRRLSFCYGLRRTEDSAPCASVCTILRPLLLEPLWDGCTAASI